MEIIKIEIRMPSVLKKILERNISFSLEFKCYVVCQMYLPSQ